MKATTEQGTSVAGKTFPKGQKLPTLKGKKGKNRGGPESRGGDGGGIFGEEGL